MNTLVVSSESKWPGLSLLIPYSAEFESVKNHLHSTCCYVQPYTWYSCTVYNPRNLSQRTYLVSSCVCNHCMSITFNEHLLL